MKFVLPLLVLLAAVGHLNAYTLPSTGSGELAKELQDFLNLLPVNEIVDLTKRYLARDREFQIVNYYVQSDDIKRFVRDMEAMPEFLKLMKYLEDSGLEVHSLIQELKETLEMGPVVAHTASGCKITGGFFGFTKDLAELLPVEDISSLFEYKVETSRVFAEFANEILSPEYTNVFTATFTNPYFLNVMSQLEGMSIDSDIFHANFSHLLVLQAVLHRYVQVYE